MKIAIIVFFIVLIIFGAFAVFRLFLKTNNNYLEINGAKFNVEIADTPIKQTEGLSGYSSLCEKCGMLFIFPESGFHYFWMKEMLIPLDFIWINNGYVIETAENVKPEDYQPPNSFSSKDPADMVLEVNAGTVKKFNIKGGDIINWE